jgi:hypothetical protein
MEEFDVVVDALMQRYDALWKLTLSNMNMGIVNVMDDIRLKQMDEIKKAISLWENKG